MSTLQKLRFRMAANSLLLGVAALILVFALMNDRFLTVDNIRNISVQISVLAVVSVPMAVLLITGKVDLSVGSTLALGAVTSGLLITHGYPMGLAILVGVLSGAAIGVINGFLVTVLELSPLIVTLGALTAVRGLAITIAPNPVFNFPESFLSLGDGEILGIPNLALVALAAFLAGSVLLMMMPMGRHVYAIGVNPEAAYLSGVRVGPIGFLMFGLTGAAAGLAGVMLASRLGSAPSGSLGVGFELEVLTAVILGGVAFGGGRGTMLGVLLGVIFLGVLQNGLTLENVPAASGLIIKGGTLVVAAWLDRITIQSEAVSVLLKGTSRAATGGTNDDSHTNSQSS